MSRRTEAIYGLRTIFAMQADHFMRHGQYSSSFQELGSPLEGGRIDDDGTFRSRYYTFTLNTWDLGSQVAANYRATATADASSRSSAVVE